MPLDNRFVYHAPFWARGPVAQTSLGRARLRRWGRNPMLAASKEEILTTSEGIQLQGFTSARDIRPAHGLVILLPGWEGSANSTYMICTGRLFFKAGYSIYRLNYRDHGGTQHLNEGLFHGALLQEVAEAVHLVIEKYGEGAVFLVGFSLGGNYALRLARLEIPHLRCVFAVSPVLDPLASTRKLDENPLFRAYFREKWLRSLRHKEALYPQRYQFEELYAEPSILGMTELLLKRYTSFPSAEAYFDQYTLTPDRLADLKIPAHVVASVDDPVVADSPYTDYYPLEQVYLSIQQRGGHVGFVGATLRIAWYERVILKLMSSTYGPIG